MFRNLTHKLAYQKLTCHIKNLYIVLHGTLFCFLVPILAWLHNVILDVFIYIQYVSIYLELLISKKRERENGKMSFFLILLFLLSSCRLAAEPEVQNPCSMVLIRFMNIQAICAFMWNDLGISSNYLSLNIIMMVIGWATMSHIYGFLNQLWLVWKLPCSLLYLLFSNIPTTKCL